MTRFAPTNRWEFGVFAVGVGLIAGLGAALDTGEWIVIPAGGVIMGTCAFVVLSVTSVIRRVSDRGK